METQIYKNPESQTVWPCTPFETELIGTDAVRSTRFAVDNALLPTVIYGTFVLAKRVAVLTIALLVMLFTVAIAISESLPDNPVLAGQVEPFLAFEATCHTPMAGLQAANRSLTRQPNIHNESGQRAHRQYRR